MVITVERELHSRNATTDGKCPHYADWALPLVQLPNFDRGSGVYCVRNILNGQLYIGSTINFKKRKQDHLAFLHSGNHDNIYLQRAWNKYGERAFEWSIMIRCGAKDVLHYEQCVIDIYSRIFGFDWLYNLSPLTRPTRFGKIHTEESKRKIVLSKTGARHSLEAKRRMSIAQRGKKLTEEHKAKLKIARNLRPPISDETRHRMSVARKGKKCGAMSEEQKKKLSIANKGHKPACMGKPMSEEQKAKISLSHKGKILSPETKAKMSASRIGKKFGPHTQERKDAIRLGHARRKERLELERNT